MADNNIELSGKGIKFSYTRFLSDSAAGFVLIIILIFAYYNMDIKMNRPMPGEVKTFLCLLLFFISTPIGLAINALSWASLGWVQTYLEKIWFSNESVIIKGTKVELQFEECVEYFGIKKESWQEVASYIESMLDVNKPDFLEGLKFLEGLVIFLRNLSLLSLVSLPFYCFLLKLGFINTFIFIVVTLTFSAVMSVTASFVLFYYNLHLLSKALFYCKQSNQDIKGDMDKISKFILSANHDAS